MCFWSGAFGSVQPKMLVHARINEPGAFYQQNYIFAKKNTGGAGA